MDRAEPVLQGWCAHSMRFCNPGIYKHPIQITMKPSTEKISCACHKEAAKKHSGATTKGLKIASIVPSVATSVFIAFFPKCPVCWGVYMSMFSGIGLARLPYMKWLLPVLLVFLGLHLYLLYVRRK